MLFNQKVIIPAQNTIYIIDPEEIIFCKTSNNYTTVYVLDGNKHLLSKSLAKFSQELKSPLFLRVHQSYLINTNYLKQINKKEKEITNDFKIPFTISIKK